MLYYCRELELLFWIIVEMNGRGKVYGINIWKRFSILYGDIINVVFVILYFSGLGVS